MVKALTSPMRIIDEDLADTTRIAWQLRIPKKSNQRTNGPVTNGPVNAQLISGLNVNT